MDVSEGIRPADELDYEKHFGCSLDQLPKTPPRTVVVRAGGRGGKTSRLLAPKAIHAALTVPVPTLGHGESAYSVLVAPTIKLARQALSFVKGYVDGSDILSKLKVGEDADHVALRRHDGKVSRIEVFAAGRGGTQLRGKTLLFAGMDEASFLRDEATGQINDAELYRAVLQRIVPGGQCWIVSTPWAAGVGLLEDLISKNFGSHENALCAVAPTRDLNPSWDPDGSISADLIANDPDAYEREVLAIPLTAGSSQFFSPEAIKQSVNEHRPVTLSRNSGSLYASGGDCAFKRNSSALVVVERAGDLYRVAEVVELRPEKGIPLKVEAVVLHFANVMHEYGDSSLVVDSHEREAVSFEAARHNISVVSAPDKVEGYLAARKLLHEGKVELPNHPRLIRQLRDVMVKPQSGGGLSVTSPRKADGSHGDLVSALVLALWQALKTRPYESVRFRSRR